LCDEYSLRERPWRMFRILRHVLGLAHTVIKSATIDGDRIVVDVRPHKRHGLRCPVCGRKCEHYDTSDGPRLWRAMDLARAKCYLRYTTRRVRCPEHGVLVESVPWARHRARCTRDFEDWVAYLTVNCTVKAVTELARIQWKSVGPICSRVFADLESRRGAGRFDGLRRIGIDETSYRRGHKYITVVVDHDRGCLVWAHAGTGKDVLNLFLDQLTRGQRRGIEVVTADGAKWIKALVKRRCPNARWVMDPFHVVQWMTEALDKVRCEEWRGAKRAWDAAKPKKGGPGRPKKGDEAPPEVRALKEAADEIKGTRWSLLKNPEDLTDAQAAKLESLKKRAGSRLFRAWELKEDLRAVFKAETGQEAAALLERWLHDAAYCKIKPVVEVEKKVRRRRADVVAAAELGISNGRVEAINNKVKVTVKMGYGFRNTDNLIALTMLRCSDMKPELPGRPTKQEDREKAQKRKAA